MRLLVLLLAAPGAFAQDAATIMRQVSDNMEQAADGRRQYVYQQTVRSSLIRMNGQLARRENREYSVLPSATGTEKTLTSFQGEFRKGKQSFSYSKPVGDDEDAGIDGQLLEHLTENLVNAKNSRDGIPRDLFPLRSKDLPFYVFTLKGEFENQGRRTYRVAFEPVSKNTCVDLHLGGEEVDGFGDCPNWMGEAWIDAAELEPVRIVTRLAFKIPWAVRVFLGTNLKQTGFSVTYKRVAQGVWFPDTYGTEFQVEALFFYKRTITLNLTGSGYQKTEATSTIQFKPPAN